MDRKKRIARIFKELVSIQSFTDSPAEEQASDYIHRRMKALDYFNQNPGYLGQYKIKNDIHGRSVPYGFIQGKSNKTVVYTGHYDVVNTDDYGDAAPLAFSLSQDLEDRLNRMGLPEDAQKDMDSKAYLWGRGVSDMKSGLSIQLALFEEYAEAAASGQLPDGNLIFVGVCDEESYSAGMRAAVTLLSHLKTRYDLEYSLCMNSESMLRWGNKNYMSIGSVGKCMPAVLVQGVTAHVGHAFDGLNPLSIMSEIHLRTNGSPEFSDKHGRQATMPPTWTHMRDIKEEYDVSIPLRAAGYMTVLTFTMTPDQVMEKLKRVSSQAFESIVKKTNDNLQRFKKNTEFIHLDTLAYDTCVMSFEELVSEMIEKHGAGFDAFYKEKYARLVNDIASGNHNYPSATIEMMKHVLDFANYKKPLILLGFSPPYYPAVHSNNLRGTANTGSKAFEFIKDRSKALFDMDIDVQEYAMGITDVSYCAIDQPFDYKRYSSNTPMWGQAYNIDFESIEHINMPSIVFGPIGMAFHQWTERVQKDSLYNTVPVMMKETTEVFWK